MSICGKMKPGAGLVVFDIGNVLLRWEPRAAFRHALASDAEIDALFGEVGFYDWNYANDRGRSRAEAVAAIAARWPEHADLMAGYFDRFAETIRARIEGTWEIAEALRARGLRLWALTNFAAETWPEALRLHPGLGEMFEGIVVSGHEGMVKPEPEIFALLCARAGVAPEACYFTDDSAANVAGARAAGWQAHLFEGPEGLRAALIDRGLL
tara:strand:+ start:601 stop:1233 length:633 start_codon:yes stop_codon:yes gene_type:complete